MTDAPRCPYCGDAAVFQPSSADVYQGRDYGPLWRCQPCSAWVGCHQGTDLPLGRLADATLRAAKRSAHAAFDPIWTRKLMGRAAAYAWLADQMGLPRDQTHIGMFDVDQCILVETLAEWWRDGREPSGRNLPDGPEVGR